VHEGKAELRGLEVQKDASEESADAGAQRVFNGIRQAIIEGTLRPGQRLTETDIMEEYNASRGAARSALGMLVGQGLVERVLYQGARVRRASLSEMIELTEIRAVVEGMMAARAAMRATDDEIAELRQIAEAMALSVQQSDFPAYNGLNQALHHNINRIADQRAALELVERLRSQSGIMHQYRLRRIPGRSKQSAREHAAIVEAIADRDPERAEAAMRTHLTSLITAVQMATHSLEDPPV
jgi:DNA-binding GntR family transcriptional regulator